jgi:hypothetical protein
VPDWDNTESRESDEDATWRDLVARFDAPLTGQQPVPWPAREDMPGEPTRDTGGAGAADGAHGADGAYGADAAHEADGAHGADGKHRGPDTDDLDGEPGRHAADGDHGRHAAGGDRGLAGPNAKQGPREPGAPRAEGAAADWTEERGTSDEGRRRVRGAGGERGKQSAGGERGKQSADGQRGMQGADGERGEQSGGAGRHGRLGADGVHDPEVIQVPRGIRGPVAGGVTPADDEEHFVPPTPPPLPKLDPVAKGAWAGLFGGPGYLIVATAAGWTVSGLAAFCAVAAFVAGFAILVLRMHDREPGGPNDGDDGAVV